MRNELSVKSCTHHFNTDNADAFIEKKTQSIIETITQSHSTSCLTARKIQRLKNIASQNQKYVSVSL